MRWLLLALAAPGLAQGLHFGLKGGVPLTAYYETGRIGGRPVDDYSAATRRYTVGPSIEYLGTRWGVEAEVLFKRQGYVKISESFFLGMGRYRAAYDVKGDSWDIPLLVKYRFSRWYAAGGLALRYIGPVRALGEAVRTALDGATRTTAIDTTDPAELKRRWYAGVAVGVGREFGRRRLRLHPEIRFTHWATNIPGLSGGLQFKDQADFLLGLVF